MADATPESPLHDTELIQDLDDAQREELDLRHALRVGKDVVWVDLEGRVRRERATSVYYVQTARGVFRISRLTGDLVEV